MSRNSKVVIAEDHTILREGLKALLSEEEGFNVIGEARDGKEAIQSIETHDPDLILIDLSMPRMDGLSAIKEIKKITTKTKIVVLTVHNTEEYIHAALKAGADGYVLKDANQAELIMALKTILSGKSYLSPDVSNRVIAGYLNTGKRPETPSHLDILTQREVEILKLIGEGSTNKEIAKYLHLSAKTIEKHRANIMKKLKLHNTAALTTFAIKKGIVTI